LIDDSLRQLFQPTLPDDAAKSLFHLIASGVMTCGEMQAELTSAIQLSNPGGRTSWSWATTVQNMAGKIQASLATSEQNLLSSAYGKQEASSYTSVTNAAILAMRSRLLEVYLRAAENASSSGEEAKMALGDLAKTCWSRIVPPVSSNGGIDRPSRLKKRKIGSHPSDPPGTSRWAREVTISSCLRIGDALQTLSLLQHSELREVEDEEIVAYLSDVNATPELRLQSVSPVLQGTSGC